MLPFIGIMCVTFGLILCVYYFFLICRRNRLQSEGLCVDEENAFEVVKLVEALREICPPGSGRGWTLVPLVSEIRCWKRILPFEFLKSRIHVFSCSSVINHSATSVLNVVADIYTWADWEPAAQQQRHLEAEISDDPDLHGDRYMQCDQVIALTGGHNPKPGILMHRFGNLEANGVCWILTWHIRQLDWSFFLAQPIENETSSLEASSCLLTLVRGVSPYFQHPQTGGNKVLSKEDQCSQLVSKLLSLKQAIQISQLQLRPFLPVIPIPRCSLNNPHLPTIRSALHDLTDLPCVLLRTGVEKDSIPEFKNKKHLLAVVPFSLQFKPVTLKSLRGFVLVPWPDRDKQFSSSGEKKSRSNSGNGGDPVRRRAQRPQTLAKQENGSVNNSGADLPSLPCSSPFSPLSLSVSQNESSEYQDVQPHLSQASSGNFFSNFFRRRSSDASTCSNEGMVKNVRRNSSTSLLVSLLQRSPAPVREYASDGEKNLRVSTAPFFSDDNNNNNPRKQKSKYNGAEVVQKDNSETEDVKAEESDTDSVQDTIFIVPELPRRSSASNHFLSIGQSCTSQILLEVQKASGIDITTPQHEQKQLTGGWVCEGIHKDVLVLMKMNDSTPLKTISYLSRGVIPASPQTVWKSIRNPLTRFMYDETVKKVLVIEELPNDQKILYTYHESVSLLKRDSQDFCLLHTEQNEGPRFMLALQSVDHPNLPPKKDVIRGTLLPSGWIIEPMTENANVSLVTYIIQYLPSVPARLSEGCCYCMIYISSKYCRTFCDSRLRHVLHDGLRTQITVCGLN